MSETKPSLRSDNRAPGRFLRNVLLKTLILLIFLSLGFAWLNPIQGMGRISLYNTLYPGRLRLPFGEDFEQSYNLSILQLEAMFSSHEISAGDKPENELRVLLLGDSSIWGFLLSPDQTLSAELNKRDDVTDDNRIIKFYNLGYPTMSVMKDLMLLNFAQRYELDIVVWFVTLESLPLQKQVESPLVQYNPEPALSLIDRFGLGIDSQDTRFVDRTFLDRTLVGQRRELADLIRLQLLGVMWAATGIDHVIPKIYEPLQVELEEDLDFQDYQPGDLNSEELALDVIQAGIHLMEETPVIIVNEPILIATGQNSDLRYNSFYPRWAYDEYREILGAKALESNWSYLDLWDTVPAHMFTDSAIHYSPEGVKLVVDHLSATIRLAAHPLP